MKINLKYLELFTHIFFCTILLILLIRVIFFGSCWIWLLLNLSIYLSTWASLERTKEEREMKRKIKELKEKNDKSKIQRWK